jgi:citrate lyase acyl carrier protein
MNRAGSDSALPGVEIMKIEHSAYAGSEKKGDTYVHVFPSDTIQIDIVAKPTIVKSFGKLLEEDILDALRKEDVTAARIELRDGGGALDFVVRARVRCALRRAREGMRT